MVKKISTEQARINRKIAERKRWLLIHEPICIFCLKPIYGNGDPCHKIRKSYASSYHTREELHTMPLNIGLGHRDCHIIFDDKPAQARLLPGISKVLSDIEKIDVDYYKRIVDKYLSIVC